MTGRGLVSIRCPGGGVETGYVVRVGRANDGGVSRGVDFLRTMSAASSAIAIAIPHTHQEDIDAVLHEMSSGSNGKRKRRTEAAY